MQNTLPNQPQNKPENKPQNAAQNQQQNQPVKPFEKLFPKPEEKSFGGTQDLRPEKPVVPPAKPPAIPPVKLAEKTPEKKTENKGKNTLEKTDDKQPIALMAVGALAVVAILFYGYVARQDKPVSEVGDESDGLIYEESTDTEEGELAVEEENEEEVEEPGEVAGEASEEIYSAPVAAPQLAGETKTFNSDAQGVTLTYATPFSLREEGNKIFVDHSASLSFPVIEVFDKDADMTLREAVLAEFRGEINLQNCFVVDMLDNSLNSDYVKVGIHSASGVTTECGPGSWGTGETYFLMNPLVPEKFVLMHGAFNTLTGVTIEE